MTRPDLDAIERMVAAATPGPWEPFEMPDDGTPMVKLRGECDLFAQIVPNPFGKRPPVEALDREGSADASLIANARTDIPALVAYARELEATLANERGEGEPPVPGFSRNDFDPKNIGVAWYMAVRPDGSPASDDEMTYRYVLWVYREPAESAWRWELDDDAPKGIDVYLANGVAPTAREAMREAFGAAKRAASVPA